MGETLSNNSRLMQNDEMIKFHEMNESFNGKAILITGAARRVGKIFALACARAGADIVIHHGSSDDEAEAVRTENLEMGHNAWIFKADLSDSAQAEGLIPLVNELTRLDGLVNSAAIFESLSMGTTSLDDRQKHLQINLTAPFLLSQAFAREAQEGARIVNIVDWRALRPGAADI